MQTNLINIMILITTSLLFNSCFILKDSEIVTHNEGVYPISIDNKWMITDTTGNVNKEVYFDELHLFKYGLAVAKKQGKYGYVNSEGRWVIKPKYDTVQDFYRNCAQVTRKGKTYYITQKGRRKKYHECSASSLIQSCYRGSEMKTILDIGKYVIQKGNKYGVVYEQVKDTSEYIYDSVKPFDSDFFIVERNGKFGFFFRWIPRVYNGNVYIADTIERYEYDEIILTPPITNEYSGLYHNLSKIYKYRIGDRWGLLDWRRQRITEPKYLSIVISVNEDYYLVQFERNKFGYVDSKGNEMFRRE